MKKVVLLLLAVLSASAISAQKCLQFSITPLVANLPMPVSSANSYMNCSTVVNGKGQTIIKRYSFDDLDSIIIRDNQNFFNPQPQQPGGPVDISPANPRVLPPQQGPGNPVLASAQLPLQTAATAMAKTTAAQPIASATPSDNAATIQLVTQTYDIGANQLAALDAELNGKLMALLMPMQNEMNAVSMPSMAGCPMQQPGALPACACVNGLEDKYWTAKVAIEDKYDAQRVALLESYLPRIKALAAQVDANITQLQYGDAVQTATYKMMLLNAQSAAFNNAINIEFTAIKNIDQSGADLYVHKYNADHLVEDISCQK